VKGRVRGGASQWRHHPAGSHSRGPKEPHAAPEPQVADTRTLGCTGGPRLTIVCSVTARSDNGTGKKWRRAVFQIYSQGPVIKIQTSLPSVSYLRRSQHPSDPLLRQYQGLVKHTGGCHCGAVRFEVWASDNLHVFDCNCSICVKKQNRHFIVPASHFKLLKGADHLTTYTFNTHSAQHTFCKTCGVQSFYTPRSNPDGYGIAPHCLDEGTITKITVEPINGKEWEKAVKGHPTIRNMSKP
uniref:CENP-V/GFA domain-containing protein n=1 Tax=Pseudonaja textilis TaxID=8673 RepID=A0A670ZG00_PSETE